jgi:hypothetical protein
MKLGSRLALHGAYWTLSRAIDDRRKSPLTYDCDLGLRASYARSGSSEGQ